MRSVGSRRTECRNSCGSNYRRRRRAVAKKLDAHKEKLAKGVEEKAEKLRATPTK